MCMDLNLEDNKCDWPVMGLISFCVESAVTPNSPPTMSMSFLVDTAVFLQFESKGTVTTHEEPRNPPPKVFKPSFGKSQA